MDTCNEIVLKTCKLFGESRPRSNGILVNSASTTFGSVENIEYDLPSTTGLPAQLPLNEDDETALLRNANMLGLQPRNTATHNKNGIATTWGSGTGFTKLSKNSH
jgi:hypothetical protein